MIHFEANQVEKSNLSSKVNTQPAFYCLLFLLFLLPIPLGANRPWAWSFFELAFFSLSFYVTFLMRYNDFAGVRKYNVSVFLWLGFISVALLQIIPMPDGLLTLFSPMSLELYETANASSKFITTDIGQSKISLLKLLSLFCLFLLVLQLVNTEERIRLLLLTMLASGTFQALYGSLEILLGFENSIIFGLEVDNRATGSFVYHNHFANFLMLCLCAGLGLIVTALEKERARSSRDFMRSFAKTMLSGKAIIRICLAILVIALVMSKSRMGNIAFFTSMALTGGLALILIKNRSQGLLILVSSMFIIDLLIVSAYFGLSRVQERLMQTSIESETRDEVVKEAMPIIQDFPLFGSGAGSFYSIFPSYQKSNIGSFYDHAHNEYLQFFIEYGTIGMLFLSSLLIFSFYKGLRAMRKRKNTIFKGLGFACTMAIIGMMMHMIVDFPLQGFANACYFVVFLALSMLANGLRLRRPYK